MQLAQNAQLAPRSGHLQHNTCTQVDTSSPEEQDPRLGSKHAISRASRGALLQGKHCASADRPMQAAWKPQQSCRALAVVQDARVLTWGSCEVVKGPAVLLLLHRVATYIMLPPAVHLASNK
jgi:hypothetical protein